MTPDAGHEARYRAIAADLAAKIRSGHYAPGRPCRRSAS